LATSIEGGALRFDIAELGLMLPFGSFECCPSLCEGPLAFRALPGSGGFFLPALGLLLESSEFPGCCWTLVAAMVRERIGAEWRQTSYPRAINEMLCCERLVKPTLQPRSTSGQILQCCPRALPQCGANGFLM
jgi:hypothetical protein